MTAPEDLVAIIHEESKGETIVRRDAYEQFMKPSGWKLAPRSDQPKDKDSTTIDLAAGGK